MNFYVVETRPNKYGHTHYLKVNYHENTFSSGIDGENEKVNEIISDDFYTFVLNVLVNRTDFKRV